MKHFLVRDIIVKPGGMKPQFTYSGDSMWSSNMYITFHLYALHHYNKNWLFINPPLTLGTTYIPLLLGTVPIVRFTSECVDVIMRESGPKLSCKWKGLYSIPTVAPKAGVENWYPNLGFILPMNYRFLRHHLQSCLRQFCQRTMRWYALEAHRFRMSNKTFLSCIKIVREKLRAGGSVYIRMMKIPVFPVKLVVHTHG